MSRVGNPINRGADKVKVSIADNHVAVEGPKGKLEMDMPRRTSVSQEENTLKVARDGDDREAKAMHGWPFAQQHGARRVGRICQETRDQRRWF